MPRPYRSRTWPPGSRPKPLPRSPQPPARHWLDRYEAEREGRDDHLAELLRREADRDRAKR